MAKIDYSRLAADVLAHVGGEQNVKTVSHCATRLRFVLKDPARADKAAIAKVPGVISTVDSGRQFQVVVGNDEWAEQRRYLGLDAIAAARRVGEPVTEEVIEPDLRALTA